MAEYVTGAVVGAVFNDLYNVSKDAVRKVVWCKKYCQKLQQDLDMHHSTVLEICNNLQNPLHEWEQRFLERFKETLEQGRSLVVTCLQLRGWHPIQRFRYSRAILKLRQQILQHLQNLPVLNTLQLQQLNAGLQDVREQQDKDREEVMGALKSGNASTLVDWARQGVSCDRSTTDERLGKRLDELIHDQFLVGLDNQINEVKSLLLSGEEEKMVMIVGGMGGIGKTTLALAICKDPQVRDFFEDRIHFFTVSKSPDMKGLLSSIWEKLIVEKPVPLFQNEEDAYRQVKDNLLDMTSERRLLVLDDVWSKANLENLSFDLKGLRTMITTRQAPTLETRHSHTYTLGLLSKENAQSLFCYWAFGQDSIPPWVEEPLVVEEVILECKCLPLALKVIGASLSSAGQFPIAWRNARNKLQEAKLLGDYHKDALQGRLQTSIDALDPILRECFLDLGAYPEDSKCSADTLLDIWVYVRGMEWVDAVFALAELGSRCLLNFCEEVTSADVWHALECGSASALVFSQHDVMRDLALYLGRNYQHPSQRTRLLMPRKVNNIPKDWQSKAHFAAQVISISTGGMMEQDWPPTLSFPSAEALLLYIVDGSYYHLPPFIQSMCKLKVMFIRGSYVGKVVRIIVPSLRGLSQLQSIQMDNVSVVLNTLDLTMSKLEKLWLFDVDGVAGVLSKGMENLTCLSLQNGYKLKELPTSFCEWQRLQFLEMQEYFLLKLPNDLGQLSALKGISLKSCIELRNLPESFGNLSNLKTLDLSGCKSLSHLPRTFGKLVALKKLDLGRCRNLQDLPENFGLLSSLENLVLDCCTGLQELPQNLELLRNLKQLSLQGLSILKHLPERVVELSCLKKLDLLGCFNLKKLPDRFGELSCLEYLSLEECWSLKDLPVSFGMLRHLKVLNLTGAAEVEALPENFGQLSCLEFLSLEYCAKLKQLPESFGQLSALRTLELDGVGLESLPTFTFCHLGKYLANSNIHTLR